MNSLRSFALVLAVLWSEYDVSPLLRDGTNVFEVTLGKGRHEFRSR